MILNEEQKKQFALTLDSSTNEWFYDCKFVEKKFARAFFGDWISFLGNMIIFDSCVKIGNLHIQNCLCLVAELQHTNITSGIAIQRLYSTLLGSVITDYTQQDCFLNENVLFFNNKQLSIMILKPVRDSIIFHIFIPLSEEKDSKLSYLKIEKEKLPEFKQRLHDGFYELLRSVFFESQEV
jgi:hypothetical protein